MHSQASGTKEPTIKKQIFWFTSKFSLVIYFKLMETIEEIVQLDTKIGLTLEDFNDI